MAKQSLQILIAQDAPVDGAGGQAELQSAYEYAGVLGRLWCQSLKGLKRTNVLLGSQPCRATQHSLLDMPTQVAGTARVVGLSLS